MTEERPRPTQQTTPRSSGRPSTPSRPPYRSGSRSGPRGGGNRRQSYGRGRYQRAPKVCAFCLEKTKVIDYKDISTLRRFVTDRAKIRNRRKTGTCAKHQRRLSIAIKRARLLALLPFTAEHIRQR